jgi:hypothetical protein
MSLVLSADHALVLTARQASSSCLSHAVLAPFPLSPRRLSLPIAMMGQFVDVVHQAE